MDRGREDFGFCEARVVESHLWRRPNTHVLHVYKYFLKGVLMCVDQARRSITRDYSNAPFCDKSSLSGTGERERQTHTHTHSFFLSLSLFLSSSLHDIPLFFAPFYLAPLYSHSASQTRSRSRGLRCVISTRCVEE